MAVIICKLGVGLNFAAPGNAAKNGPMQTRHRPREAHNRREGRGLAPIV